MNWPTSRAVIGIGWLLYVPTWFMPVYRNSWPITIYGWEAFRGALIPDSFDDPGVTVSILSALTNVLMIASPFILFRPPGRLKGILQWSFAIAAVVNAHWWRRLATEPCPPERPDGLQLAYYLWLTSFLVLAVGCFLRRLEDRRD